MTTIDWKDQTVRHELTFQMVSPQNIDKVIGTLEGVDLSGSTLTASYYTDVRVSGKIKVDDGNWVRGSFIRIIDRVPEWNWTRELATCVVTDDDAERSNGRWVTTLTLQGMLKTLSTDITGGIWVMSAGSNGLTAIRDILNARGCKYRSTDAVGNRIGSTVTLDSGKSQLEKIFAMTTATGNRIDTDGHGTIVVSKYVAPARKSPVLSIDVDGNPRGIAHDGLQRSSDYLSMPNRCIVSYNYSESSGNESQQRNISASAELPSNNPQAYQQMGYVIASVRQVNELNPATWQNAYDQAKSDLNKSVDLVEWKLTTQYLPIWEGDVVALNVPDGPQRYRGARKCLVKELELALDTMQMQLTLKETASGDDE